MTNAARSGGGGIFTSSAELRTPFLPRHARFENRWPFGIAFAPAFHDVLMRLRFRDVPSRNVAAMHLVRSGAYLLLISKDYFLVSLARKMEEVASWLRFHAGGIDIRKIERKR